MNEISSLLSFEFCSSSKKSTSNLMEPTERRHDEIRGVLVENRRKTRSADSIDEESSVSRQNSAEAALRFDFDWPNRRFFDSRIFFFDEKKIFFDFQRFRLKKIFLADVKKMFGRHWNLFARFCFESIKNRWNKKFEVWPRKFFSSIFELFLSGEKWRISTISLGTIRSFSSIAKTSSPISSSPIDISEPFTLWTRSEREKHWGRSENVQSKFRFTSHKNRSTFAFLTRERTFVADFLAFVNAAFTGKFDQFW